MYGAGLAGIAFASADGGGGGMLGFGGGGFSKASISQSPATVNVTESVLGGRTPGSNPILVPPGLPEVSMIEVRLCSAGP